jgi:hypothetical protein
MRLKLYAKRFRSDKRAVSPAISTVIITSAIVVMVLVAMVYTQNFLNGRLAENEFTTNKQFMLTTGLQLDDIAWTIGRTQTVRYSCRYSQVHFEPQAMRYSIEVNDGSGWHLVNGTMDTGVVLFNMPVTAYSMGNNYFERVYPPTNSSFLNEGPSAPVSQVYVMEKLPMDDGSFVRVVIAPSIRQLTSTIGTQTYVKFFLPLMSNGMNPELSQSLTLVGRAVSQAVYKDIERVRFQLSFPKADEGFNNAFFPFTDDYQFEHYEVIVDLPANSVVEFYAGEVSVSKGAYV